MGAEVIDKPRAPGTTSAWLNNLAIVAVIAALWPLGRVMESRLNPYILTILVIIGINVILATSLNLINGITGQFSLGHAGFMAIGAYAAAVPFKHYQPAESGAVLFFVGMLLLGGVVAAVAGLVVGIPALRLRGDYLAIATLGFGEIIGIVINNTESIGPFLVGAASGLHGIPAYTNFFWVYASVIICVVCIWRIVHSTRGKAFLAVREDEIAAAATGVDTTFHKVLAFGIGAFFAGIAGALSAMWFSDLDPSGFGFMKSIEIVVMVVLGGSGSITGVILAAVVLTYLPEQLRFLHDWRMVIYSLLLIVMMLLRPEGLLGRRELWWTRRRLLPARTKSFTITAPPTQPPVP